MVDATPQDSSAKPSGTGDGGGVSKTAFYTSIITVLATMVIMPMWTEYLKYKRDVRSEALQQRILEAQSEANEKVEKIRDGQIETHEVLQSTVSAQQDTHEKLTTIQESLAKPAVGLSSPNVTISVDANGPREVPKDAPDK